MVAWFFSFSWTSVSAFDCIDHEILLTRLYNEAGICSTAQQWFWSYLTDITQHVTVHKLYFENRPVTCGVTQGFVSGPVLFCLYTTQLGRITEKQCLPNFFADDTELHRAFHSDSTPALTAVGAV